MAPSLAAFELLERYRLGRRRSADTLLAATLLHHGITEVITCNPRDFAVFEGLKVIDPRLAANSVSASDETEDRRGCLNGKGLGKKVGYGSDRNFRRAFGNKQRRPRQAGRRRGYTGGA